VKPSLDYRILGRLEVWENGDITESSVTIIRVVGKARSNVITRVEGGVIERVGDRAETGCAQGLPPSSRPCPPSKGAQRRKERRADIAFGYE
jgi:hypothetical protein